MCACELLIILTAESGRKPYAPGEDIWTFAARAPMAQETIDAALAVHEAAITAMPSGYAGQFLAVAEHLAGRSADLVTAQDGVRSLEFVAAVYLSAREARAVDLPIARNHAISRDWVPA